MEEVTQQLQLSHRRVLELVEEDDLPPCPLGLCGSGHFVEDALGEAHLVGEVHGQVASFRAHIGISQSSRADLRFELSPPSVGIDGFAFAGHQRGQALFEIVRDLLDIPTVIIHLPGQSDDVGDHRLAGEVSGDLFGWCGIDEIPCEGVSCGVIEQYRFGLDADAHPVFADNRCGIGVVRGHGRIVETGQGQVLAASEVVPQTGQKHSDASTEFSDGFSSEGQAEDLFGRHVLVCDQPHHSLRDDGGLSGAGPGGDFHRLCGVGLDDHLLLRAGREGLGRIGGCELGKPLGSEAHQFSSNIFGPIAGHDDRTGQD